ncbi:MAG: L-threonylcarbamoyladenylate synthase [Ghiorsea sp.]|nr:L-threonylcarbamoyladenylate synthase [Ghiorsea sp.]
MITFEHMRLHPERPQIRQIKHAAKLLQDGLFAVVPTETTYAIMALPSALKAQETIRKLRNLDEHHLWSLVVANLSQAAQYVSIDNPSHRILKHHLPGPYTFILPANSKLPKRIFGKRKDVGIRMPDHAVCHMLLQEIGEPLLATSMQFPDEDFIATDPDAIEPRIKHLNAILLDAGWGDMTPTTIVDLCDDVPQVLRQGLGEWGT